MSDHQGIEQFHHPRPTCRAGSLSPQRQALVRGLSGVVLELGAGDGVKLRLYPPEVTEITAVEPDFDLCGTARDGSLGALANVRVVNGHFGGLPVPGESVDAVVSSLALCSVSRLDPALAEIMRVLRPGGQLRFYEHVLSANPISAVFEKIISPIWTQASGGCHPARDTAGVIARAGFALDGVRRFDYDHITHVLGTARRT